MRMGVRDEDSKNNNSSRGRPTRSCAKRKGKRTKYTKFYEDEDSDSDMTIPNQYIQIFEVFKNFIDDFQEGNTQEPQKPKGSKKRVEKAKAKEKEAAQNITLESESKFANDSDPTRPQVNTNFNEQPRNENSGTQDAQRNEVLGNLGNNEILEHLQNASQAAQGAQASNLQSGAGANLNLNNLFQTSSNSLYLLQRIIQTTPEIQLLHHQEQQALYTIQQNIRQALSQSMGQDIISQLVIQYQKTQEQHQLSIQAAIQRKLTMILCSNTAGLFGGQGQNPENSQPQAPNEENENIEVDIFKYNRSSYHLGISYYIYSMKRAKLDRERLQQQHQQWAASQGLNQSFTQASLSQVERAPQTQPPATAQAPPPAPQPAQNLVPQAAAQAPPQMPPSLPSLQAVSAGTGRVEAPRLETAQMQPQTQHQAPPQHQAKAQPQNMNFGNIEECNNMMSYMKMLSQGIQNQTMQTSRMAGAIQQQLGFRAPNMGQEAQLQNQIQGNIQGKPAGKDINAKVDDLMKS